MSDYLIKVLNRWIECSFWIKLLNQFSIILINLTQVELLDKFSSSLSLSISRLNE
jgi:hypothetical protein